MQQPALSKAIKNDMWISGEEEEVSDPSPLPSIPGYHVLIRPVSIKTKTKGGVVVCEQKITRCGLGFIDLT